MPSYDGRTPEPPSAGDGLLWIPRVVLAPTYVVGEYVLRAPLSAAIPAAEEIDFFTKVYNFFAFGPDNKAGIFPVALAEFNLKPSVGIYAFWDDAGFKGNDLSLHTEAWPDDWFGATLQQRILLDKDRTLQLRFYEMHRPDRLFYGIGPNTLESSESRYGLQQIEGDVSYEWRFWQMSRIETTVGMRDVYVFDGHYGSDPSLTTEAATGAFPIPYGYGLEYTAQYDRVIAAVDSRVPEQRLGSGARLELGAEQGSDVRNAPLSGWVRYGATAAGYIDLTGTRRVLGLSVMTQFADPLGAGSIPFTELVYLGGDHAMQGFWIGRLLGRSAAVATASYAWPIGPWVDGDLQLAVGNVFGEHLSGFDPGLLRFSGTFGLSIGGRQKTAIMGSQDAPLQIIIGIGSETFDHGGQIDSLRLTAGVPLSF